MKTKISYKSLVRFCSKPLAASSAIAAHFAVTALLPFYLLTFLLLTSCSEPDANITEYSYPEASVTSVYPESGYTGTQVMITGNNFGDRTEAVKLTVGGDTVTHILSCANNRIIFEVPEDAQSGNISLQVWTHRIDSAGYFTVIPTPEITSIKSSNPAGDIFATAGDQITILGKAFGDNASDIDVTVNGIAATVTYVDNNQIVATLPQNFTSGVVMVRVRDITLEGTALIDPSLTGDVTSLFLKNYCQPFERAEAGETEWAVAKSWIGNSYAYMAHTLEFTDDEPDGIFVIDGNGRFNGASIYQITTLPPGNYEFQIYATEARKTSGRYGATFAVGKGDTDFPTLANVNNWTFQSDDIYCQASLVKSTTQGMYYYDEPVTCSYTFTETTNVRIGFGVMLASGQYFKIKEIRIIRR